MFKEISKINFSEFENIIKNPSQFLQEYNLSLSNNEIYFIASLILLFIVGVFFELFKSKKKFLTLICPILTINPMKLHLIQLSRKLT